MAWGKIWFKTVSGKQSVCKFSLAVKIRHTKLRSCASVAALSVYTLAHWLIICCGLRFHKTSVSVASVCINQSINQSKYFQSGLSGTATARPTAGANVSNKSQETINRIDVFSAFSGRLSIELLLLHREHETGYRPGEYTSLYVAQVWLSDCLYVCMYLISQLPNLFIGTPRICNFILMLIVWVRSFRNMLPSVKFAEDKVLVFVILREKC